MKLLRMSMSVVMPVAGTIRFVVALARLCLLIQGWEVAHASWREVGSCR
jgi:hypothetical protein